MMILVPNLVNTRVLKESTLVTQKLVTDGKKRVLAKTAWRYTL